MRLSRFRTLLGIVACLALACSIRLGAMPPPEKGELAKYRADGSLPRRQAFAREIGNHRMDPLLVQDAQRRLIKLADQAGLPVPAQARLLPTPPLAWRGMPSTGTVKMLVLCIDFSDYPHDDTKNSVSQVDDRIFGDGETALPAPYESLNRYYSRASYTQLNLVGNVLGWYRPAYTRASISQTTSGRQNLIKEALQYYDQQGHDFGQYDNNGDGKIDYFAVLWSGPDNGWSNFWWAYQTSWSSGTTPVSLDGKTLGKYSWQWETKSGYTRSAGSFDPLVLIHETGHALGLPDYYDYDEDLGPDGGVGGLDMMDANRGDHNSFSKFVLDWINPTVYTTTANGVVLVSSGDNKDGSAAIFMDSDPGSTFGEYFMVQNRHRIGNDLNANYPSDGLLIWHVDARLDTSGSDYLYDNSYTDHKLLRLMEADGLEQIESYGASANAGDYYIQGRTFGPGTQPNSSRYDGSITRMGVQNISVTGPSMTLDIVQINDATAPTGRPNRPSGVSSLDSMTFTWTLGTAADPDSGIAGYRLQVGTTAGGNDVFDGNAGSSLSKSFFDLGLRDGQTFYARVAALNGAGLATEWSEVSEGVVVSLPAFPGGTLEASSLVFKTIGPWTQDATTRYAGADSARSAAISDMSRTYLQTRITGPGTLKFHWKVSSEANYDFLTLSLDGVALTGRISGAVEWTEQTLDIPAGSHVVRWTYAKDQSEFGGTDQAWVDNVIWNGATVASATVSPASWTAVTGSNLSYRATVANAASDNRVNWSISNSGGTFSPLQTTGDGATATTLSASATPGTYTVTASPVESGGVAGTGALTLVNPADVVVALSPVTSTVGVGANVSFTGSVSIISDGSLAWTTSGGSLGATTGQTNTWSASAPGVYTITASSVAAPGRSTSATVTVVDTSSMDLVVTPATKALRPGQSFVFAASGDLGGGVTWTLTGAATKVDNGLQTTVTVPSGVLLNTATYTLTATSRLDTSKSAQAVITVKTLDLNGDGVVDTLDVLQLTKRYGSSASGDLSVADFDGDGDIDDTDLNQLLAAI